METTATEDWHTDADLFASLPGGDKLIDWFGFVPDFHDATLEKLDISGGSVTLVLAVFRMTREVDAAGYFVLDRHALVTITLSGVSGIVLNGDASSIIFELRIRRISSALEGWPTCGGPEEGDFEIDFSSSYGLYGRLFSRSLAFEVTPAEV